MEGGESIHHREGTLMVRWLSLIYLLGLFLVPGNGFAHESRPAYLEITETQAGQYDVLWKRPMRGDRVLGLHPQFPSHCRQRVQGRLLD